MSALSRFDAAGMQDLKDTQMLLLIEMWTITHFIKQGLNVKDDPDSIREWVASQLGAL